MIVTTGMERVVWNGAGGEGLEVQGASDWRGALMHGEKNVFSVKNVFSLGGEGNLVALMHGVCAGGVSTLPPPFQRFLMSSLWGVDSRGR
jgi:hypothetical protein